MGEHDLDQATKGKRRSETYDPGRPCRNGHLSPRRVSDGRCLECDREAKRREYEKWSDKYKAKSARYYASNKAKAAEQWRERYQRNREIVRQLRRESGANRRAYYKAREIIIQRMREYKRRNKERLAEYARAYRARKPEVKVVTQARRRARLRSATVGKVTGADIRRLFAKQSGTCAGCGCSIEGGYHVDHIVPLAKGGPHTPSNLQLLCPPCNMSKGSLMPDEWKRKLGSKSVEINVEEYGVWT